MYDKEHTGWETDWFTDHFWNNMLVIRGGNKSLMGIGCKWKVEQKQPMENVFMKVIIS